ncbi:MAG TPA: hypothetical protein VNB28_04255 [Methylomirabilota bacterium]|jgi:hypothetical protein|nr:hypothetical protein [Methylomirabilota bacterium]
MALTLDEMREIVSRIRCLDYEFHVLTKGEVPYLQVRYVEPDIVTGDPTDQHGRKWMLSHHMVRSELVQTALKAVLTSMEHRAREHFFFEGQRVFNPHFDVLALAELARDRRLDVRKEPGR